MLKRRKYAVEEKLKILIKYEISYQNIRENWIKRYNSRRELKDTGKGMSKSMTKGGTPH